MKSAAPHTPTRLLQLTRRATPCRAQRDKTKQNVRAPCTRARMRAQAFGGRCAAVLARAKARAFLDEINLHKELDADPMLALTRAQLYLVVTRPPLPSAPMRWLRWRSLAARQELRPAGLYHARRCAGIVSRKGHTDLWFSLQRLVRARPRSALHSYANGAGRTRK
jgi:hypothetical protein